MTTENQETPNQGLKFPIMHDKCPHCGSTQRVAETVANEEVAKGKLSKDIRIVAMRAITPVADIKIIMMGLSIVPVLTFEFDQCANPECGAFYPVATNRQDMPASEVQKMMGIAPQPPQTLGFQGLNRQQRRHGN